MTPQVSAQRTDANLGHPLKCRLVSIWRVYLAGGRLGEERSGERSWNRSVDCGCVTEVEKVVEIVRCARIGETQTAETEDTLDRFHDAAKVVVAVAYVADFRTVGRHHQQRYAKAELIVLLVHIPLEYWRYVIVPAAPVVPGNEDRGVFPVAGAAIAILIVADCIH